LTQKDIDQFNELLNRQLSRLKRYGQLVEQQESLLDKEDHQELLQVLERKSKILTRMEEWDKLSALAAVASAKDSVTARKSAELLERLLAQMELFAGLEAESLKKAAGIREELAGGIYALRKGKKLLRKYVRVPHNAKARFKDIKT
jgi:hypothetical protein